MSRKSLFSGLMALALVGSLSTTAMAAVYQRTITLGGDLQNSQLRPGDTIQLNLVNPTNRPLIFETMAEGKQASWTIPARNKVTVNYTYSRPVTTDIGFVVRQAGVPNTPIVARGVLVQVGNQAERPVSTQTWQQIREQPEMIPIKQHKRSGVRGYY